MTDWADGILDGIDRIRREVDELTDPTLRIGVTGLSGAGKTVFITALVASLLDRGRMRLLAGGPDGSIDSTMLRPQPDRDVPRFAFETHLADLTGPDRRWPQSTRQISQLRVSIRYRPGGLYGLVSGLSTLHLDIVDYPGEWLLDLPLLTRDYATWSVEALALAESPARGAHAGPWRAALDGVDPAAPHDETVAERLAAGYRAYLNACRAAGHSALAPGRLLMPGDREGAPIVTFAPLPAPPRSNGRSLYAEMARRYDGYRREVVRPFFRDHFARLDRQVVLVDALGALAGGPRALGDLTATMADTLEAFRHGRASWFDRLLGGRRIDRLLLAATKADHLHSDQHARLAGLVEAMLAEARRKADYHGADTQAMAIAAIRATSEQTVTRDGAEIALVRGVRMDTGRQAAIYPGALPSDPRALLSAASSADPGQAPDTWPDGDFARIGFRPPEWGDQGGPPHLRLDSALDWLIGDRLS